jgi:hypothetical protein
MRFYRKGLFQSILLLSSEHIPLLFLYMCRPTGIWGYTLVRIYLFGIIEKAIPVDI